MTLSDNQKIRYSRNILVSEIGEVGQLKLLGSKVLVVGAGGLGSAVLLYLAAAGIGKLGIIDSDIVELSNLQRQIIHDQDVVSKKKIESARAAIESLNSDVEVCIYDLRIDEDNLVSIAKDYNLIVDASDNFFTRFAISKIAHTQQKPMIFGAVREFSGQTAIFKSYQANNPCYSCFNPNSFDKKAEIPLSEKGIIGAVAGIVGSMQAVNTIKELLGIGENLVGKILIYDFLHSSHRIVSLGKKKNCKICHNI